MVKWDTILGFIKKNLNEMTDKEMGEILHMSAGAINFGRKRYGLKKDRGYIRRTRIKCGKIIPAEVSQISRENFRKINESRRGKTYVEIYGVEMAKKMKEKLSKRMKEKNPSFLEFSKEHRKNISEASKKNWENPLYRIKVPTFKSGDENISKLPTIKEKHRISALKQWGTEESRNRLLKSLNISPNKVELKLMGIIAENNLPFNYVGDGKIWFNGEKHSFNPDFLSKNPKHIIEVFGEYHHNLPKNKEKDKERIETYSKYGYKTLIIWSKELEKPYEVINKIKEFMK